jgi:hypothetical protein
MKSVIVLSLVLIVAVLVFVTVRRQEEPMPYEAFTDAAPAVASLASKPAAAALAAVTSLASKPAAATAAPAAITAADLETFRKSLKEELLNSLKFDSSIRGGAGCNGVATPATEQGVEYIRKDSIPCWGCKL